MDDRQKKDRLRAAAEVMAACPTIYPEMPMCGFDCPPGWLPLVAGLSLAIEMLVCEEKDPPRVHQVKEKFGGLHFYISHGSEDVLALIEVAESASRRTCQDCGAPGELRPGSWLRTLCDACVRARR